MAGPGRGIDPRIAPSGERLGSFPGLAGYQKGVLACSVAVLAWACREMLRDLFKRGADPTHSEPGPAGTGYPRLSLPHRNDRNHRHPNGVRH